MKNENMMNEIKELLLGEKVNVLKGEYDSYTIIFEPLIEEKIFIEGENKQNFELLSYVKFKLNKYLESFYYGFESFKEQRYSIGIVIAAVSLFRLRRNVAGRFVAKYKDEIISAINSSNFSEKGFNESLEYGLLKSCLKQLDGMNNPIKKKDFNYIERVGYYSFKEDDFEIKSYKSEGMINVHLLRFKDEYLILDCGAEIRGEVVVKADLDSFLKGIQKEKIKGAIISHAHLDHYGSLDLLYDYTDKIYMGEKTLDIIEVMERNPILSRSKIEIYKDYKSFSIADFEITPIPNGHILGSSAFMVSFGGRNLFYTGDFCLSNQNTVSGLKKKDIEQIIDDKGMVDYLLTESTYGHKEEWLTYSQRKEILKIMIGNSYRLGVKVFIPSFALGRAQECHSIINESDSMYVLVDGLASKVTSYYNKHSISSNLITRKTILESESEIVDKYNNSPIIIASSGMLQNSSIAMRYYDLIMQDKMTTIIKCGYMDKETVNTKLKSKDGININLIEINLSAHGQYEEIIDVIELTKPKNLIMVHGDGIDGLNDRLINEKRFLKSS